MILFLLSALAWGQPPEYTYLERGIIKAPIGYTIAFSDKDDDLWEETKEYKDF